MTVYILDNKTFRIKWFLQFHEYDFVDSLEFSDKSWIKVSQRPEIENDDFVLCKDGDAFEFFGICENYEEKDSVYTIYLRQAECLFDRFIFVEDEDLIQSTGIEDFVAEAIENGWISSGDITDKDYLTVSADTHTPVYTSVNSDNGVYNLKTFLGNIREYYQIHLSFDTDNTGLSIHVYRDGSSGKIDTSYPAVSDLKEVYAVDVLAKLMVKWKVPDTTENGVVTEVGPTTYKTYYLRTNRSITEDQEAADRADGVTRSVYIEKPTLDEMYQEVLNEFKSNSYEHKITFRLANNNISYPISDYYVGKPCSIRTTQGVKSSIITRTEKKHDSAYTGIEFGKLPVKFIDKMRRN